jgi:nitroreductase
MDLARALTERRSVRAFLDRPVADEVLDRIFAQAQKAPSWCNIQPWRVWLTRGEATKRLTARLLAARHEAPRPDFAWPAEYPEPYGTHRKACGKALYEAMGVARNDSAGREAAWLRNFVAFDAPHVAIVGVDRRFDIYAALDIGCWLQSLLLSATSEGLATCAQASLAIQAPVVREELGIPDGIGVLFGIAIGYEDTSAAANACRTTREPVSANVTIVG